MSKSLMIAALGITLVASPALAGGIHVSLQGKSMDQIHAEVVSAAKSVCHEEIKGEPMLTSLYSYCVTSSVKKAIASTGDSSLIAFSKGRPIFLASN
jgi:hypothetical protein